MLETLAFMPFLAAVFTKTANATEPVKPADYTIEQGQDIVLDVPFLNQKEALVGTPDEWAGGSACGPTAIAMALKYEGENYSLYEVVNSLPTNVYVKGVQFYNLKEGPKQFGYIATEIEIDTKEIFRVLSEGNPILMNVQNYDGITGHEIVVVGIIGFDGENAKSLIVHDPFTTAYREFEYINEKTLKQPEGYVLPIGIIKPFYITKATLADASIVK